MAVTYCVKEGISAGAVETVSWNRNCLFGRLRPFVAFKTIQSMCVRLRIIVREPYEMDVGKMECKAVMSKYSCYRNS